MPDGDLARRGVADVSICVLSYNGRDVLERCLRSIFEWSRHISMEVMVTDNGSSDGTADMVRTGFPEVQLFVNVKNENFTRPFNRMMKNARGRYVLLLNNDIEFNDASLEKLISFLDGQPKVGAVAPMSSDRSGGIEAVCRREVSFWGLVCQWTFFGWWFKRTREASSAYNHYDLRNAQAVEIAQDSCLLLRHEAMNGVGVYDERFRLYYTEDDLCRRIRQQGWQVFYYPEAKVWHVHSYTTQRLNPVYIKWLYVTDMLRYSRKYLGAWRTNMILLPLVYLSLGMRSAALAWRKIRPAGSEV